jgi:hypothetical protein
MNGFLVDILGNQVDTDEKDKQQPRKAESAQVHVGAHLADIAHEKPGDSDIEAEDKKGKK